MNAISPPPRWFREAVLDWLDKYESTPLMRHRIGDLFTLIVEAQPPDLRVVGGES